MYFAKLKFVMTDLRFEIKNEYYYSTQPNDVKLD